MEVQNSEQHVCEAVQEETILRTYESIPVQVSTGQCDERSGKAGQPGPHTPSDSDNEPDRRSRRRSPRRRRRSADSYRSRSRTPERRSRYFEEYRPRRRFEHDMYRHWNYGYVSDWRPRGRRFPWWRGSGRGYGGPRYSQGRRGWYGGFDRKPARFYPARYSERYQPRSRDRDWYSDSYEYAKERAHERVRRRRDEYDEDRRSRRDHDHERTRRDHDHERSGRDERASEDKRAHVTSTRTLPADDYKEDMHHLESTYADNYTEVCT